MAIPPKVWVLLGSKAGGNGQMTSLADALGWPYEAKQLVYHPLNRCPNLLLGASLISLDRHQSSPLTAPWPDLLIAASRRSVPVARWIKKQSGGRTRLVHLIHTQAPLEWFDLIITAPQYCLPSRQNVLHNTAALNRIAPERLTAAASHWEARLANLPRPRTALLVGGHSSTYQLDPATAAALGRQASAHVRTIGGSLLVSTSPRTPAPAAEALFAAIDCPAYRYRWQPHAAENPYLAYLALADSFIVTVDSASQVVEACLMGKPVSVFEWPSQLPLWSRIKTAPRRWLELQRHQTNGRSRPERPSGLAQLYDRLVYCGLMRPTRDFEASLQALERRGLLTRFGEVFPAIPSQPLDDMERAVTRIRQLFADGS
ncbi:MAG: mitochondrial fission ELM1 family protein [Deltaproteobacteria bacterium]|nr:mitochondrial fission ELM1 family protein [Deltaproteobacteria bacterium]